MLSSEFQKIRRNTSKFTVHRRSFLYTAHASWTGCISLMIPSITNHLWFYQPFTRRICAGSPVQEIRDIRAIQLQGHPACSRWHHDCVENKMPECGKLTKLSPIFEIRLEKSCQNKGELVSLPVSRSGAGVPEWMPGGSYLYNIFIANFTLLRNSMPRSREQCYHHDESPTRHTA